MNRSGHPESANLLQRRARVVVLPDRMGPPADAACEPTTPTQVAEYKLPELSRSQTTLDVAEGSSPLRPHVPGLATPVPVSSASSPVVNKRKSLRLRPAEILDCEDAVPLPLMSDSPISTSSSTLHLRPKTSKMSLFNLFSKPKVEKLRGYAEPGLNGPPSGCSNGNANTTISARQQHLDALNGKLRPSTSKSYSTKAVKLVVSEPTPSVADAQTNKMRSFDAPPLFQVWPQATKHADLEVSALASDMGSQRSTNRMIGTILSVPGNDTQSLEVGEHIGSIDARMTSKTNTRAVRNGSLSPADLPSKLIILVTSGYLLQYAASGPSDRYPEKILQLQKESAAYASDLIPGKHHVLQVVQSVNDNGVVAAASTGFFSKIGLRSQVARRSTSNLLLVMPGAEDLDEWMTAIRQAIERQGGKKARPESSTSRLPQSEQPKLDLRKTPSLSHRYQVRRDASLAKVSLAEPRQNMATSPRIMPQETGEVEPADKSSEQATVPSSDGAPATRPRASSDTPSTASSTAPSEHEIQLDKLRDSTRSSHASTMASTVGQMTSRTNSMTSTSPVEFSKDVYDAQQDHVAAKGLYRNLSSYYILKRRSNVPMPLASEPLSPRTQALRPIADKPLDSPVLPTFQRQKEPLSPAQSDLDLQQAASFVSEIRPESFLGDLPDSNTWANMTMPGHKSAVQRSQSSPEVLQPRTLRSGQGRPVRNGSQSFSLPLRINPSDSTSQRVPSRRVSQSAEGDAGLRSPIPAATTLIAKVDPSTAVADQPRFVPNRTSFAEHAAAAATAPQVRHASSPRLSLFPSAASPAVAAADALRRSPSMALNVPHGHQAQQASSLRRPASLQVRTDHAPFLSSLRTTPLSAGTQSRSATTIPIRSLKPSRSATAMPSIEGCSVDPAETFDFSTRRVADEESDQAMPLPARCDSPFRLPKNRKVRASAPLPELDFGIPLVGLGPPAPPPQAPLPELPPASRPTSRAASRTASRSSSRQETRRCTPIGVVLSSRPTDSYGAPAASGLSFGLGIQVGGQ